MTKTSSVEISGDGGDVVHERHKAQRGTTRPQRSRRQAVTPRGAEGLDSVKLADHPGAGAGLVDVVGMGRFELPTSCSQI
jgi:hypothetical protein